MADSNKPKIMFMAPDVPFLPRGGGNMRMLSVISAMSAFSRVLAACMADELSCEVRKHAERLGVEIVTCKRSRLSGIALWAQRIKAAASCSNIAYHRRESVFFEEQFHSFKPDLVWLETPYLLRYALERRGLAPIVVDYWGTSEGQWRDFLHARGAGKIWQFMRWKTYCGSERKYARLLDGIVTVTERDTEILRSKAGDVGIWPVFSGLQDAERAERYLDAHENEAELVFSGNMSFKPNVDAAVFFADSILPLIRREIPDAYLNLVGRNPSPEICALKSRPGIKVTGAVPDMFAAIAEGALYVLPMRLGSGYRTKLFDVFALGKAIVTTTVGAEGLAMEHGRNCVIADAPDKFAGECVRLLRDKSERQRLGSKMRAEALRLYSQENTEKTIKSIVSELC